MNAPQSSAGFQPAWTEIESFLDDAMAMLDETDRAAVLLRYFKTKACAKSAKPWAHPKTPRKSASAAPWNACVNFSRNET